MTTYTAQIKRSTPTGDDILWTATAGDVSISGTIIRPNAPVEALRKAITTAAGTADITIEMTDHNYVRLARVSMSMIYRDCAAGQLSGRERGDGHWTVII